MSNLGTPIEITLYGPNDEPLKTYSRSRVPAEILLQAMELAEKLDGVGGANADLSSKEVRAIYGALGAFIVEVFGAQFSLSELLKGSETGDMMTVLTAVVTRAQAVAASNPTFRPAPRRPRKRN